MNWIGLIAVNSQVTRCRFPAGSSRYFDSPMSGRMISQVDWLKKARKCPLNLKQV